MGTPAWELAERAAERAGVELRPLTSVADADDVIRVMVATWGDYQTIPRETIHALAHSGNVPFGAFADGAMVGYVLGWAGVDADGLHVHSHMLAALPDRRHAGVGYALKLAQRAQALDQGITVARWTFDPLVARNAYFNVTKLGAVADRFGRAFYGEMADDLNRGDRSDRLVVRWDLERRPRGRPFPPGEETTLLDGVTDGDVVRPVRLLDPEPRDEGAYIVHVPRDYEAVRRHHPDVAGAWRDAVAEALEACFAIGMRVSAFDRRDDAATGAYSMALPSASPDWPEP